ncbi:hypothetical protein GBLP1_g0444 [Lactiplantibacillus plantarum]|nr:hypothetical protein GBLP1_g0444 [Lactiplantibacillus plantarum]
MVHWFKRRYSNVCYCFAVGSYVVIVVHLNHDSTTLNHV